MASNVDICNSALNMIGGSNIISLTEDSRAARVCNQRYEFVRDAVFRAHPWNCLITRTSLAADSDTPAFEFDYQHTLPADCLRVLRPQDPDTVFKVEGRKIISSTTPFPMIYTSRVTDPNQYDLLLIESIAARLAADISYALVNSASLSQMLMATYESKLSEARFVDATEGTPDNAVNIDRASYSESDIFIASRL
nr:tail tubular protein A [uncultured Mediterranean phage uvMED]